MAVMERARRRPKGADVVASGIEGSSLTSGDHQLCDPPHACRNCLGASGLAAELTEGQIEALFSVVHVRRLPKGEVLIREGEFDNHVYVVARGEFEVTRREGLDHEVALMRLGPGTISGELAFLDGLKRTATVKAATDGACALALEREGLESMLMDDPQLVYRVMRSILRSAQKTVGRMDETYAEILHFTQD
jgi:CRP-like cAMP-binding protein